MALALTLTVNDKSAARRPPPGAGDLEPHGEPADPRQVAFTWLGFAWAYGAQPDPRADILTLSGWDDLPVEFANMLDSVSSEAHALVQDLARDPFPGEDDTDLWQDLINHLWSRNPFEVTGIFGLMRGLRLSGCRLERKEGGGAILKPPSYIDTAGMKDWIATTGHLKELVDTLRQL